MKNCKFKSISQEELIFMDHIEHVYKHPITLVDVGANKGLYTRVFCESIPCKRVHLFEPTPTLYHKLPSGGVYKKYNMAIGRENTTATFYECKEYPHLSSFLNRSVFYKDGNSPVSYDVKICKLQDIIHDEHVQVLKIDTEGYELEVLSGCHELLENKKIDYIQFEYGGCNEDLLYPIIDYLREYNYNVYDLLVTTFDHFKQIEETNDEPDRRNYFARRADL